MPRPCCDMLSDSFDFVAMPNMVMQTLDDSVLAKQARDEWIVGRGGEERRGGGEGRGGRGGGVIR